MRSLRFAAGLLIAFAATAAQAQTPACNRLDGQQKDLASQLLAELHPYDCCDGTIAECLQRDPVCALAWRLAENLCRRVARGEDRATATRGLERRARSMMAPRNRVKIDLDGAPLAGPPDAPVTLVEYACARCPFCAKITPPLYQAVREGSLAGKLKFYFKLFPIRSHEHSKEAGLGFLAAAALGRFWEFALYAYERFDEFCVDKQGEWAAAVGMDRAAFERLVDEPATRERLLANKKEGIVNKVEATPTFFINGRGFAGDLDIDELVDVLEEEHDRVTGVQYRDGETGRR